MRSSLSLRSSPTLPLKRFQCSSDWRWPSLVSQGIFTPSFISTGSAGQVNHSWYWHRQINWILFFNPFTAPACKISGLKKCTHTPSNSRFYGALAALCVLMKTLSNAKAKKKQKGLRISNFALLFVVLECHHGNEGVNYKITPAYSLFNGTAFRTCLQIAQSPEADTVTWRFRKAMMIKMCCWRNTQNALIGAVIALVIKRPAEKN